MDLDKVIAVRSNKTIYRDGGKCVKVFHSGFSKADVLNEALNLARVEETGLAIPRLYEVTMIDGQWAIISEYIKGTTLSQLMAARPERKEDYMERFVELQMTIQSKSCPLLSRLRDKMDRKIGMAELDATTRYALHARLAEMPRENRLCHGDYCPSNVLIAEDGTPYILDWAHATQGSPAADAARTYLALCLQNNQPGAERYLELFCQKSGVGPEQIHRWMPIVAAAQSVKSRPEEREALLRWGGIGGAQE